MTKLYVEFPCAMRLLENDGQISSENMGKNTILAVLYLHIKWKYNAKRLSSVIVSVLQHTYKLKFTIGTIVKSAAENIYSVALKNVSRETLNVFGCFLRILCNI